VLAAYGTGPTTASGGIIEVRGGSERFSLGLGGRFDAPTSIDVAGGTGVAYSGAATFVPCVNAGWFSGCAVAALGAMHLEGNGLPHATGRSVFYGDAGLRAMLEPALSTRWFLRVFVEAAIPFAHPTMAFGDATVWQASWVSVHAGLMAGLTL
jgi:hypothetical protein